MLFMLDIANCKDHPRIRREHFVVFAYSGHDIGSPPHTQGTPSPLSRYTFIFGITPAYAGNTHNYSMHIVITQDHPRIRREHPILSEHNFPVVGSPPLTRGTLFHLFLFHSFLGITPAYAGNTPLSSPLSFRIRDHPRLRGEHVEGLESAKVTEGSPPLTRGTLTDSVNLH